jgi:hypothetical protein
VLLSLLLSDSLHDGLRVRDDGLRVVDLLLLLQHRLHDAAHDGLHGLHPRLLQHRLLHLRQQQAETSATLRAAEATD